MNPGKIAVVAGYMPFFNSIMTEGFPADRESYGRRAADALSFAGEVDYVGLMDSEDAGHAASQRLAAFAPNAIVLVPTMATPARYLWNAIAAHPDIPLVLWTAHERHALDHTYDMVALCRHSQNVGALMIGNILSREGRPFAAVTGPIDDPEVLGEVRRATRVASLAGGLRKSRIGRLGRPLPGYDNVDADTDALRAATGIETIDVSLEEWQDTLAETTSEEVETVLDHVRRSATLREDGGAEDIVGAARMAAALETVSTRHHLAAGAINCRGAFGVENPAIGTLGCLAVSYLTSVGRPFACTGDIITAVAMLIGRAVGGASLYCELDAIDPTRDAFLCANTGEGDFGWSDGKASCQIFPTTSDSGRQARGCSVCQHLRIGAATMIGFSPRAGSPGGHTLIAMEGDVLEPPEVALTVSAAWFRARAYPMRRAFTGWLRAGATHHGSLSPGHQAGMLSELAAHLGIGFSDIKTCEREKS